MRRAFRVWCGVACLVVTARAQDYSRVVIEFLGRGYTYTEGPVWSKDGFLLFSDTAEDRIWKWTPGAEPVVFRQSANGPSGNALDSQGRLYTCETHARRVTRTNKDGRIDVLADAWEGKKLNAPADLVVSHNDHVYFTDPAFGSQADDRELDFYGVYHLPPKGPLKLVAKPAGRPNGIALSPTGRLLYVTNTDDRTVRVYDVDHNGDTSNERVLLQLKVVPGGLRVNEKGDLFVATPQGIAIHSPEGKLIHTIELAGRPSNCAFDADGKALYVTARGTLYRVRPDAKSGN